MATETRIGAHEFISLTDPPEDLAPHAALETRSGVEGIAVWDIGKFGDPFVVESVADANDIAAARALLRKYRKEILSSPVTVVWAGQTFPQSCIVLDVQLRKPRGIVPLAIGVGGLTSGKALIRCVWTLLAVD